VKRLGDLAAVCLAAPVLVLPMLVIAALVRLRLGAPVLFQQKRAGLHGAPFALVKFRTMAEACASHGSVPSDAARLDAFGRFLRATSLDELPELWNVLRGEMSLVGPRPLLLDYLPLYTPDQARRHEVRPGLTGWAQVNGRNALCWSDRFRLDLWYVEHASVWLDLRILVRTVVTVFARHGISAPGEATMAPFRGLQDVE
jgi:lipopolysaccharide/colanic/teichoic acid biosynthesis glycosyltransferase